MSTSRSLDEYKEVYSRLESDVSFESEIPNVIKTLGEILSHLNDGRLDEPHKVHVLNVVIPRIVAKLLKTSRILNEDMVFKIHEFFRVVIVAGIQHLHLNLMNIPQAIVDICQPDQALYSYKPTIPAKYQYRPDPSVVLASSRHKVKPVVLRKSISRGLTQSGKSKGKEKVGPEDEDDIVKAAPIDSSFSAASDDDEFTVSELETDTDTDSSDEESPADDLEKALEDAAADVASYSMVPAKVMANQWIADSINFFGFMGGFTKIIKHMVCDACTINYAAQLLYLWASLASSGYLVPARMQKYVSALDTFFVRRLRNLTPQDIKPARWEDFEILIKNMGIIYRPYVSSPRQDSTTLEPVMLYIIKQILTIGTIDRRLHALQLLNAAADYTQGAEQQRRQMGRMGIMDDYMDNNPYNYNPHTKTTPIKGMSAISLATWLRDNHIVEDLFGTSRHSQLVSKSAPLVKFLASVSNTHQIAGEEPFLSVKALGTMWDCATNTHESGVADDALNLLSGIVALLPNNLVTLLLNHLSESLDENLEPRLLAFTAQIAKFCKDTAQRVEMLDILWTYGTLSELACDKSEAAITYLIDCLKSDQCSSQRSHFIELCLKHIKEPHYGSKGLIMRLLEALLKTFPTQAAPPVIGTVAVSPETIADVVSSLQSDSSLVPTLIKEFTAWKTECKILAATLPTVAANTVLSGRLPYMDELRARLNLLFVILSHSQRIRAEYQPIVVVAPGDIWDQTIECPLLEEELNEAFNWFLCSRAPSSVNVYPVNGDVVQHLFLKMLEIPKNAIDRCNLNFFRCFQRYFIDVNVLASKLVSQKLVSVVQLHSYPEVTTLVPLSELLGVRVFWTLAVHANEQTVVDASMDFLLKLTEKIDGSVAEKVPKWTVRESFIKECLSLLGHSVDMASSGALARDLSLDSPRRRIMRCLRLLINFMDLTEPSINSEPTRTRAAPIRLRVKVILDVASAPILKFTVGGDVNTPFKVVFDRILANLEPTLTKYNVESKDLVMLDPIKPGNTLDLSGDDEAFTTKTIGDIGFEDMQRLVFRRATNTRGRETTYRMRSGVAEKLLQKPPIDAPQKAQEVMEFSGLSFDMAMFALRKHFWDVHRTVDVLMDESKLASIVAEARRSGVSEANTNNPQQRQNAVGRDEITKLMVARTRLLLSASTDESLTASVDKAIQSFVSMSSPELSLPSFIMSRDPSSFERLFDTLSLQDSEIHSLAWKLLWRLPVSSAIRSGLLAGVINENSDFVPDWEALLPSSHKDLYRLHYSLSLIDQIVFPLDVTQVVQRRVEWAHWFLSTGGVVRLLNIFLNSGSIHDVDVLALVLKLTDFFWGACLNADEVQQLFAGDEGVSDEFLSLVCAVSSADLALELTDQTAHQAVHSLLYYLRLACDNCSTDGASPVVYYAWRLLNLVLSKADPEVASIVLSQQVIDQIVQTVTKLITIEQSQSIRTLTATHVLELCKSQVKVEEALSTHLIGFVDNHINVESNMVFDKLFHLLTRLLRRRISSLEDQQAVVGQYTSLVNNLIDLVVNRPVIEVGAASTPDHVLTGSLELLAALVRLWPRPLERSELVPSLFNDCLFAQKTARVSLPKCKTRVSRHACYKLLLALARNAPSTLGVSLLKLLTYQQPAAYDLSINGVWDISAAEEERAASGYVGLANLGATCYANSLIQHMFMMPHFREDILKAPVVLRPGKGPNTAEENIIFQLQRIFGNLQESEKSFYNPKEFCQTFRDSSGQIMNVSIQQDVNEFFSVVCQRIESQLEGTNIAKLLSNHFEGTFANVIRSADQKIPYYSETEENFCAIALDVKNKHSLADALDLYVKPERLEGDNRVRVDNNLLIALKSSCIKRLSSTVIFHLKRFEFDVATTRHRKLNDRFEFPTSINLKPWTREGIAEREGRFEEAKQLQSQVLPAGADPDKFYQFELVGILVHSGSADSGHYYSIIRERNSNKRWLQFNDRVVSEFDPQFIPVEAFGGTQIQSRWDQFQKKMVRKDVTLERNAYMLFYERVDSADVPHVEEQVVSKPVESTPETPQTEQASKTVLQIGSESAAAVPGGVMDALLLAQQQEHPEKVVVPKDLLASNAVGPGMDPLSSSSALLSNAELVQGVPKTIFEQVWQDNSKFLRDHQIYDALYFEFVLSLLNHQEQRLKTGEILKFDLSMPASVYTSDSAAAESSSELMLVKFCVRLMVELLLHTKMCDSLPWWTAAIRRLLTVHHVACVWFFDYVRRNNLMREVLLLCPRESTRIEFADLIVGALRIAQDAELKYRPSVFVRRPAMESGWEVAAEAEDMSPLLITATLELMEESRIHWKRFKQFFGVIRDYALFGASQREFLFKKDLVQIYTDYFMGNGVFSRISIMDEQSLPDLTEFIDTLSILVRGCYNEAPAGSPLPPNKVEGPLIEMSPATRKMLFGSPFFRPALDMQYNVPAITDMITYASWYAPERSEAILEEMMGIYASASSHKLPGFESQLAGLLAIEDHLQDKRIRRAMTSYKSAAGKPPGLLAHLMEMRQKKDNLTVDVARFIVVLAKDNKHIFEYLCRHRADLDILCELLEHKTEELISSRFPAAQRFRLTEDQLRQDARDRNDQLSKIIVGYIPVTASGAQVAPSKDVTAANALDALRKDPTYAALVFVHWMIFQIEENRIQLVGNAEVDDAVFQLQDQVEKLKAKMAAMEDERQVLLQAVKIYNETAPSVQLPVDLQAKLFPMIGKMLSPRKQQPEPQSNAANSGAGVWNAPSKDIPLRNLSDPDPKDVHVPGAGMPAGQEDGGKYTHSMLQDEDSDEDMPTMDSDEENKSFWGTTGDRGPSHRNFGPNLPPSGNAMDWGRNPVWSPRGGAVTPPDAEEKIGLMRPLFEGQFDDDALKAALRRVNWDADAAVEELFDPSKVEFIMAAAQDEKKRQERKRTGMGGPTVQDIDGEYDDYRNRLTTSEDDMPKSFLSGDDGLQHSAKNSFRFRDLRNKATSNRTTR